MRCVATTTEVSAAVGNLRTRAGSNATAGAALMRRPPGHGQLTKGVV